MAKKRGKQSRQRFPKDRGVSDNKLSPFEIARLRLALDEMLEDGEFSSEEEANAFLEAVSGLPLGTLLPDIEKDPRGLAEELVYQAFEAATPAEGCALCHRALEADPNNVQAAAMLAQWEPSSKEEIVLRLRQAIFRAEAAMGINFMIENRGRFWSIEETRPYMSARGALVWELRELGRLEEAVKECEMMLDLNPNDNQGMRYSLLPLYLQLDRREDASRLLSKYEGDIDAIFAWGKALLAFLCGDIPGAQEACAAAVRKNPFVPPYLSGKSPLPDVKPACYSLGSEEEAIICADMLGRAWMAHPEALAWLGSQANTPPATRRGR